MDVLEVAICEDSPEERERLLALIEKADASAHCTTFTDGESFLGEFRPGKYDLIFMDIYMGGMTGVETVTRLRELDEEVPIAFATTSTEHTLESYRLNVLKYIEKPVGQKAVQEIIQLARLKKESRPHLHFKIDGSEVNIPLDSIIYMEQKGHELLIHVADGEPVRVNEKLDSVEPLLAGQSFYRCHKSYLVSLACIKSYDKELMVFTMKDGKNVHIRRESLGEARRAYEDFLFGTARGMDDE